MGRIKAVAIAMVGVTGVIGLSWSANAAAPARRQSVHSSVVVTPKTDASGPAAVPSVAPTSVPAPVVTQQPASPSPVVGVVKSVTDCVVTWGDSAYGGSCAQAEMTASEHPGSVVTQQAYPVTANAGTWAGP